MPNWASIPGIPTPMGCCFHGGTAVQHDKYARPGCSTHRPALEANKNTRFIWWVPFPEGCWQYLWVLLHVLNPSTMIKAWQKWDGCPNPTLNVSCKFPAGWKGGKSKGGFGRGHGGIAPRSGCGRCPHWDFLCFFPGHCSCSYEMYPISEINHCSTAPCNFPH